VRETSAWSGDVNYRQRRAGLKMKVDDVRTKLTSVYPKIEL
jgi:hypothetical protein